VVHFARKVPTVPVHRRLNVAAVAAARLLAQPRPSWSAVFIKAYAFVCAARPELRRAYVSFPWPHLYEHPVNIASVALERSFGGEEAVFFAHLRSPEQQALSMVDLWLRQRKERPIENVAVYRRALQLTRLPLPLRRLIWWLALNVCGRKRARRLGTFGVSVYGALGAASLHPLTPLTTTLNFGPVDADGNVDVHLIYDHRVLDGCTVARALQDLERVLHGEILAELRYLQAVEAA
jgi:hypothetical protein